MRRVRIFVSSPGDAHFERSRLGRVVERLNGEFQSVARLETIRWETEFYTADATFQAQIPEASACDIVIAVFRSRLGTELPDGFPPMPDGQRYPSGTAYEVLSAIAARHQQGFPDVYVFRHPEPPSVRLEDPQRAAIEQQWSRLKLFFDSWFTTPEGHFKAALQTFASTDDFEAQVEQLLRKWLEEKVLHGRSVTWPAEVKGSPFRGLAAFGAKHAAVFFGRSRDIARAVDRLKDAAERGCAFLLLDGASGAGKSSLARAGLVPRLTAAGVVPSVDLWRVAVVRVGEVAGDPIAALARRLFDREEDLGEDEKGRPAALPELGGTDFSTPAELAALLEHADATALKPLLGALDALGRGLRETEGYRREVTAALLLVVDQLDEVFDTRVSAAARERFITLLTLLAKSGRVWVIATLRADLYERLLKEPALRALKDAGAAYDLAPPEAAELAEIVRGPAAAANLGFDTDPQSGMRLDEQLLKDADRPDLLPLLQFTLNQLFEAREKRDGATLLTFAAYRALGGLEGAVDREAERAIANLDEQTRARLPRLLRQLASPARASGFAGAPAALEIHAAPLAEAAFDANAATLVAALIDARILLASGEQAEASVRLAHARVLESWQRARAIVAENADFYRIRAEVEEQRRRWESAGKSRDLLLSGGLPLAEAESVVRGFAAELSPATLDYVRLSGRAARLRQRLVAAAAVVFAGVAGLAGWQWQEAARNAQAARQEKARAEANFTAAKQTVEALIFDIAIGLGDLEGVRAEAIQKVLETVRSTIDKLAATAPNDLDLQHSRFAMLAQFGDIYARVGDGAKALATYQESLAVIRGLLAIGRTAQWQRDELVVLERIAGMLALAGDAAGAERSHLEALAAVRRLVAENPTSTDLKRDLTVTLRKLADLRLAAADTAGAQVALEEALALVRELVGRDGANLQWQNDLSDALTALGDAHMARGDPDTALTMFEEALAVSRRLVARDPGNAKWQIDMTLALERIGDVRFAKDDRAGAAAVFEETLTIRRRIAQFDPRNARMQRNLVVAIIRVAGIRLLEGRNEDSLRLYEESLEISRALTMRDPNNTLWLRDFVRGLEQVGFVKANMGDHAGARTAYEESLAAIRLLLQRDAGNLQWQRDLGVALWRVAQIRQAMGDAAGALAHYEEALTVLRKLAAQDPGDGAWTRQLVIALRPAGHLKLAAGDRAGALALHQEELAMLRRLVGRARAPRDLLDMVLALWNVAAATDDLAVKRASLEEGVRLLIELETAGALPAEMRQLRPGFEAELGRLAR